MPSRTVAVLEAAIAANPNDHQAYGVLADLLQEQGDPRGELMALQLAGKDKQAEAFLQKHIDYFLGPLAEHQQVYDSGYSNGASSLRTREQDVVWQKTQSQAFIWKNGYIHRVRLSHDIYSHDQFEGKTVDLLEQVLDHPSGRFVQEFTFQSNGDPNEDDLQNLIDLLGKKAPPTTRRITFGGHVDQISWHHTGILDRLWKGVPNLRVLEIETGDFDVGDMVAPNLEKAIFVTGGLSPNCGRNIATATFPQIRHLEIYYGDPDYGGDCTVDEVTPLLKRTDLQHLQTLGIKNSAFADDIAGALAGAPILKTLKTLDLSLGTMTDAGAEALVAARESLAHLDRLDLTDNYLTEAGIEAVQGLCKNVITAGQDTPSERGGALHYYVSVSE